MRSPSPARLSSRRLKRGQSEPSRFRLRMSGSSASWVSCSREATPPPTRLRCAYRDVALLNAAAALVVAGRARDLKEGVTLGVKSVDEGAAAERLKRLVAVSNG